MTSYKKHATHFSPEGKVLHPHLDKADEKYNDYKIQLLFDDPDVIEDQKDQIDKAMAESLADATRKFREKYPEGKQVRDRAGKLIDPEPPVLDYPPYEMKTDRETRELTGELAVRYKIRAVGKDPKTGKTWDNKPLCYDRYNEPMDRGPVNFDMARVAFQFIPYYNDSKNSAGVTLRLLQVKKTADRSANGARRSMFSNDAPERDRDEERTPTRNVFKDEDEAPRRRPEREERPRAEYKREGERNEAPRQDEDRRPPPRRREPDPEPYYDDPPPPSQADYEDRHGGYDDDPDDVPF